MSLTDDVLAGDARAIARAISMVEDGAEGLDELSAGLFGHTGRASTIGLTGSPGVGKSSIAGELVGAARARDVSVAVLATDPGVFIRSMATRGHLGGMALAAPEAIRVLDASGRDLVIVETVGVGQAEVDVAAATDTTVVVVSPGWGDAVQVAKAGILEIADIFVVNKADREGADVAVRDLQQMLRMGPEMPWTPPVVPTTATTAEGVDDLWTAVEAHRAHLESSGELARGRRDRLLKEVESLALEGLRGRARELLGEDGSLVDDLVERRTDPYRTAAILEERIAGGP